MIKKLFSYIKSTGTDVYLPAKKTGKCTSPYAVVKEEKSEISFTGKSVYTYFSVTVIVPIENYGLLDDVCIKIRRALKNTPFKFFESKDDESGDDFNGYKRTLTFRTLKSALCKKISQ